MCVCIYMVLHDPHDGQGQNKLSWWCLLALHFMNLWIYEFIFESTALCHAQQGTLWLQQHFNGEPSGWVKSQTTRQRDQKVQSLFMLLFRKNLKDFQVFFSVCEKQK